MSKTLFEFEDGEDLILNRTQWFLEPQKVILKPRRTHKQFPELIKEIQNDYAQGKYPRVGHLVGVYEDEDRGEWIYVMFDNPEVEMLFKTEYWAWH